MTANQIRYQEYLESQRHNKVSEGETNRHNVVTENETGRHNVVTEYETGRHNRAQEYETHRNNVVVANETNRHNVVTEGETNRHNVVSEMAQQYANETNRAHYERSDFENYRHNQAQENESARHNYASEGIQRDQTAVNQEKNAINRATLAFQMDQQSWKEYMDTANYNLNVSKLQEEKHSNEYKNSLMTEQATKAKVDSIHGIVDTFRDAFSFVTSLGGLFQ